MEDRMMDLEIKVAFLEKHVTDLDGVIREMAEHIEVLRRELVELRDQGQGPEKPGDERPPHY